MTTNRILPVLFGLVLISSFVSGQTTSATSESDSLSGVVVTGIDMETRVSLARAATDYPVTPGDIYVLSFQRSTDRINLQVTVDSDYNVNLGFFGAISARNFSFPELETQVKTVVEAAYPHSYPQLTIIAVATFEVKTSGEVRTTSYITVSGPARLGSVITSHLTPFSSIRDIRIRRRDGAEITVDLFLVSREGDSAGDPYLQPGDVITVDALQRSVSLSGAVERPGTYQLVEGENLRRLVRYYGNGMTLLANPEDIVLVRYEVDGDAIAQTQYLSFAGDEIPDVELRNMDRVVVGNRTENLPVVFFEGAMRFEAGPSGTDAVSGSVSNQIRYQFLPGESLQDCVRTLRNRFLTTADLQNAYLIRSGSTERIPVDLNGYLYSNSPDRTILLHRNDKVVVPFRQYFVTVSGAVANPGQFPYIPSRTYEYYLGLAGGTDTQRHLGKGPRILSVEGERKQAREEIEPEDDIFFSANNPIYHLTPVLTLVTTVISSILLLQNLTN